MQEFRLESYLTNGVEKIVKSILRAAYRNPAAGFYMLQYTKANKKANKLRREAEESGRHIPPFLIASITTKCNLHCKGCYARANHNCMDVSEQADSKQEMLRRLSAGQWKEIFLQASELGIAFILLAGGEPLLRKEVLLAAGSQKDILFPVFTNGTLIDEAYLKLFAKNRNLLPVLSIEGTESTTDERRGAGVFAKLQETMASLHKRGILFGASVTVQKNNMEEVFGSRFLDGLESAGCKAVIYVEYVPAEKSTEKLALEEEERNRMTARLDEVRRRYGQMLFVAFPGDEKSSGGCLAAGRGFFHINAYGAAEPCPFSPYSDTSLHTVTLAQALKSPLFVSLQESGTLLEEHTGGCVLFEQEKTVKELAGIENKG